MTTIKTVLGTQLAAENLRIPSDTPGIELFVRNRRLAALTGFSAATTIVMVHGATFSSGSLYDVPLGGYSFIDYIAAAGFDVYALDVRGYGHSTRPEEMEQPGDRFPPLVNTATGIRDLATTVEFILQRREMEQLKRP